jgi:uncharacterized membrane protein YhaH (DUF805 family)
MTGFVNLISPHGRLAPRPFVFAAVVIYLLGFASQVLISGSAGQAGFWAFAAVQAVLLGAWFAIHTARMRDAGQSIATATGIAAVCALSVLLLLLVLGVVQVNSPAGEGTDQTAWFAVAYVLGILYAAADLGFLGLILVGLVILTFAPLLLAIGFSIWAAMQPRAASGA